MQCLVRHAVRSNTRSWTRPEAVCTKLTFYVSSQETFFLFTKILYTRISSPEALCTANLTFCTSPLHVPLTSRGPKWSYVYLHHSICFYGHAIFIYVCIHYVHIFAILYTYDIWYVYIWNRWLACCGFRSLIVSLPFAQSAACGIACLPKTQFRIQNFPWVLKNLAGHFCRPSKWQLFNPDLKPLKERLRQTELYAQSVTFAV